MQLFVDVLDIFCYNSNMEIIILIVLVALVAISLILNFVLLTKKSNSNYIDILSEQKKLFADMLDKTNVMFENSMQLIRHINESQISLIKAYNDHIVDNIKLMSEANAKELNLVNQKMAEMLENNARDIQKLVLATSENFKEMRESNEKKLDEMRNVVDEKLNATLQDRLNKSFALVSEQLQAVTKGLGEMQTLATGVGDLKRVITNVKTRGTFGEVQLGNILEQMLAPNQFESQVNTNVSNNDRVDFVVHLPGKDDKDILLPIDAKFPMEDYVRLQEGYDSGDQTYIEKCQKALEGRIKEEAKKISIKYICPPNTTDFAIMYLATEGLYSEVIKNSALFDKLQQEYHIFVCGPTTISALLNSLQMGFKTLAIEKRSAEIWNMLAVFKKEFATYVELLQKTQKKLSEAESTIEDASKKSQKISKQLSKVEEIGTGDDF